METDTKCYIVIPVWNEANTLSTIINACLAQTSNLIVVDDCSTDETIKTIQHYPIDIIRHETNQGKSSALLTGFHRAIALGAKHVITLDGDGQHDPRDIPKLIEAAQRYPSAIVLGARLLHRDRAPWERRAANTIADFWLSWAAGIPIKDSQSGYRLYPIEFINNIDFTTVNIESFVMENELLILAGMKGIPIVSVPIASCYPEDRRKSYFHPFKDIWAISKMIAAYLGRRWMHVSGLFHSLCKKPIIYRGTDAE